MNIKFRTNTAISTNGLLSLNIRSESPFFLPPVKKGRFGRLRQPCFFLPPVKKGGSDSGNPVFFLPPVKKGGSGSTSPHAAIANAIDSETFLC